MGYVHTLHKEVLITDYSLSVRVCGTVNDNILADCVVVSEDTCAGLSVELEILGKSSDDSALVYLVAIAHACTVENAHIRIYDAVVTDDYIVLNVSERIYLATVSYLSVGGD